MIDSTISFHFEICDELQRQTQQATLPPTLSRHLPVPPVLPEIYRHHLPILGCLHSWDLCARQHSPSSTTSKLTVPIKIKLGFKVKLTRSCDQIRTIMSCNLLSIHDSRLLSVTRTESCSAVTSLDGVHVSQEFKSLGQQISSMSVIVTTKSSKTFAKDS